MSIAAFITNPINNNEKLFYVPIATETIFYNYWIKGISALKLNILSKIELGLEINKSNFSSFNIELIELKEWIENNCDLNISKFITTRIDFLNSQISMILNINHNAIIFIG